MLAFGHLKIKQQKKIEEIRRILPNLGEFDQIPQIYHEKGNFLATDGKRPPNSSGKRAHACASGAISEVLADHVTLQESEHKVLAF